MPTLGRPKKIRGKGHEVFVTLSREERLGLLRLIAKRFEETEFEPTKQDLIREGLRDLLLREGVLPRGTQPSPEPSVLTSKRLQ